MKFAAIIEYTPDAAKIAEIRPAHREYLKGILASGRLAIGGPFVDDSGAIIVYETATLEEAEAIVRNDPFAKGGVFVSWKLRPWKAVIGNPNLLPQAAPA